MITVNNPQGLILLKIPS